MFSWTELRARLGAAPAGRVTLQQQAAAQEPGLPAAALLMVVQAAQQRLLQQLRVARAPRQVQQVLKLAALFRLEPAPMALLRQEAMLALLRLPSGSEFRRSSGLKKLTAPSTSKRRRRR